MLRVVAPQRFKVGVVGAASLRVVKGRTDIAHLTFTSRGLRGGLMWISNVDLPEEVFEAHASGELVFFVGAGASRGKPSNLPLFEGLAKQLAKRASHPFSKRGGLDYYIGSLESLPGKFDAHQHAHEIISNPKSKFNPTHRAIADLADASGAFRVVTTNYDDHIAAAAASASIAVPETWYAPALPRGRDFVGLVHLHGSIRRSKSEMVLTDRDFGQAYMTEAWAARFLLSMFDHFTVVFIGYSHDDAIMRYLALGLPSRKEGTSPRRFAFTSDSSDPKWEYLRITPIPYDAAGRDHGQLVAALEAWSKRARMGQAAHQARTREVVNAGPTVVPGDDRDYLIGRLRTVEGVREFVNVTAALDAPRQAEWLRWIEDLPEFKALFAPPEPSAPSALMANWFCNTFIASPNLHGAALQTAQRLGQTWSYVLFRGATWAADQLAESDVEAGRRWKTFLSTSIHGHSAPVDTESLLPYVPADSGEGLAVLRAALRPLLVLKRRWLLHDAESATSIPDAEVGWNGEDHSLTENLQKAVEVHAAGDQVLGAMLEDSLSAAYDLLDAYHGEREWDPLAFGRSAIESHPQDRFRDGVDAVIDAMRAYGEKALPVRPGLTERWWNFQRALFRRLALHLLAIDTRLDASAKLAWLLEQGVLFETHLKHEVYRVLAGSIAAASDAIRRRLLESVEHGPDYPNDIPERERHFSYAIYNLLVWLTQADPEWLEAAEALAAVQRDNPSFTAGEHPDFDRWVSSGTWGGKLPMEPEEFVQAFTTEPESAFDDLMSRDYSGRDFDEPDWHDALRLISSAVQTAPEIGDPLWNLIESKTSLGERADDLRRIIIEGWARTNLGEIAKVAVDRVATQISVTGSARSMSEFLLEQVRKQIDSDETLALAGMRSIAFALWREQGESFTHPEESDPVSVAPLYLNSWPGDLAMYWITEVDRRWRKHRDDWTGLNQDERRAFDELLGGSRQALDAIQPALASQVFFLFGADAAFATDKVLPLFGEEETAVLVWNPYLYHPRYNDKMLAAGLLDSVLAQWDRLSALRDQALQSVFLELAASIVSFAGITDRSRKQLLNKSVLAEDGMQAAGFAKAVASLVQSDGVDGAMVWSEWLAKHLEHRLNGRPRLAEPEELARWADVVPYVGAHIPAAIDLLSGRNIGLGERFLDPDFPEDVLAKYGAALVAYYADRIRNSVTTGFLVSHQVRDLVDSMRTALGEVIVQPLLNAAAERGFLRERGD